MGMDPGEVQLFLMQLLSLFAKKVGSAWGGVFQVGSMHFSDLCVGITENTTRGDARGTLGVRGQPKVSWPWIERDVLNPIKIEAKLESSG